MSDILIYDIESATAGTRPDREKDKMRLFGCFSYKTNKFYFLTKKEEIQKIINAHRYLIGFNNQGTRLEPGYDNPILLREGIKLDYKTIIDLRAVFRERAPSMKIKEGILNDLILSYSLDFITRLLKLADNDSAKMKFDYSILNRPTWTEKEFKLLIEYTKRDIELTKKLYDWTEAYFQSFAHFLNEDDIKRKAYITSTTAKFAYKAICKAAGLEEQYGEHIENPETEHIAGGYVAYPAEERIEGNMYLLDYDSLYPHIMIMCNIFGRQKTQNGKPVWDGVSVWKTEGKYHIDEQSKISKVLLDFYKQRVVYKKAGNQLEYPLKIILNATYGAMQLPYYSNIYDITGAGDVTRLGRQWIKYARKIFRENGYTNGMSDTDSLLVIDKNNNKNKILELRNKIIQDIKLSVPFPSDTFDMKLENELSYAFFFKGKEEEKITDEEMDIEDFINKPKSLIKKNYIFVTKSKDIIIKNLGLRKKSNSELSRRIFWEHMVPKIKEGEIKFSRAWVRNLIYELLEKDLSLAALRKDIRQPSEYTKSPTGLQAQLANRYGAGIFWIIPNNAKIGVGKGKSYCTLQEFKEYNLRIEHIDLDFIWRELSYFLKPVENKSIFDFKEDEK